MNKNAKINIDHLADLSSRPEGFRQVYQLQFDSRPDSTIVDGPLFLTETANRPERYVTKDEDVLFANQLQTDSIKDECL
jgi:hypothetical protein